MTLGSGGCGGAGAGGGRGWEHFRGSNYLSVLHAVLPFLVLLGPPPRGGGVFWVEV